MAEFELALILSRGVKWGMYKTVQLPIYFEKSSPVLHTRLTLKLRWQVT